MFAITFLMVLAASYGTDGCLNNYVYKKSLEKTWCSPHLGTCSIHGVISPDIDGTLKDWRIEMKFKGEVKRLKPFTAELKEDGDENTKYVLRAKTWNSKITSSYNLDYIVNYSNRKVHQLECVQFCGTFEDGTKLCKDDEDDGDEDEIDEDDLP